MGFGSSTRRALTSSSHQPSISKAQLTELPPESSFRKPKYSDNIDLSTDPSYLTSLNYQYEHDKTKQSIKPLVPLTEKVITSTYIINKFNSLGGSSQLLLIGGSLVIMKKIIDNLVISKRPQIYNA